MEIRKLSNDVSSKWLLGQNRPGSRRRNSAVMKDKKWNRLALGKETVDLTR